MRRWIILRRFLVIGSMLILVLSHVAMHAERNRLRQEILGWERRYWRDTYRRWEENEDLRRENDTLRLRSQEFKTVVPGDRQIVIPLGWQISKREDGNLVVEPIPNDREVKEQCFPSH